MALRVKAGIPAPGELHPALEQLIDLRFRIIINTTPDNFVTRLYDEVAAPYHADFYNYYKPGSAFTFDFEKDPRVVVYNLLGTYKKPESLVLTYKHQLNYIKKIVGEQQNERLPDVLTNAFKDFRYHLFLGFDFEDWNLRLLLDTLRAIPGVEAALAPATRSQADHGYDFRVEARFAGRPSARARCRNRQACAA